MTGDREVTVELTLDTSRWDAAFQRFHEQFAAWHASVDWSRIERLIAEHEAELAAQRASVMRAAYDRRRRARMRRGRR